MSLCSCMCRVWPSLPAGTASLWAAAPRRRARPSKVTYAYEATHVAAPDRISPSGASQQQLLRWTGARSSYTTTANAAGTQLWRPPTRRGLGTSQKPPPTPTRSRAAERRKSPGATETAKGKVPTTQELKRQARPATAVTPSTKCPDKTVAVHTLPETPPAGGQPTNSQEYENPGGKHPGKPRKSAAGVTSALVTLATGGAGFYYYLNKENLTLKEYVCQTTKTLEDLNVRTSDWISDALDAYFPQPLEPLLPDAHELQYPEFFPTLVVDLDKTIAHMEHDRRTGWRVVKRPGADRFFKELWNYYEIVVWSDDNFPVAQDVTTKWGVPVVGCLHRDQCKKRRGHFVKDLSRLGRPLDKTIIVDHCPHAFSVCLNWGWCPAPVKTFCQGIRYCSCSIPFNILLIVVEPNYCCWI
eukprot:GHVT01008509.1.p1 GENE.GHVT01008509.1~~GHVT01008509.1.p1  ORF type:complete len:413 (+),score=36.24 GHVT01008509.1:435-1673(+)